MFNSHLTLQIYIWLESIILQWATDKLLAEMSFTVSFQSKSLHFWSFIMIKRVFHYSYPTFILEIFHNKPLRNYLTYYCFLNVASCSGQNVRV